MKTEHNFEIERKWIVTTPGVVFAIACAIKVFTKENEAVIIQTPVYYPFKNMIDLNNRKCVTCSLIEKNGKYQIDFEDFENKIEQNNVRLFILCSPHNPVGRVWTVSELTRLAGLQFSTNFIQNPVLKKKFHDERDKTGYDEPSIMGLVAAQAAYQNGKSWLTALKNHLQENLDFLRNWLKTNLPKVRLIEPEGTFLLWLDFSAYNFSDKELDEIIVHKAKVWLDRGTMFGSEGNNFLRINIATPRPLLQEALERIKNALE